MGILKRWMKWCAGISAALLVFAGGYFTGRATAPGVSDEAAMERYYMECESSDEQTADVCLPCLTLFDDGTFSFSYDILSSYFPHGSYKRENDKIIAETTDGANMYVFRVVDTDTLSFRQEGSSEVSLTDEAMGIKVLDGALFVRQDVEEN